MADKYISKIKDTNNNINYLKYGIYPVKGTQTAATGTWTGNINVPALYDGLTIAYYLPYDGSGNATLNLTLSDGTTTGAINCYYTGNDRLSTQYEAGHVIIFTYQSAGSIKINGVDTTDNRWITNSTIEDSSSYIEDQDPYICRASKAEMDREFLDKIVGGSLGWNQLAKELNSTNWVNENGTTASFTEGVATFTSTINNNGIVTQYGLSTFANHKYFLCMDVKSSTAYTGLSLGIPGSGQPMIRFTDSIGGDTAWHTIEGIRECTSSDKLKRIYIFRTNGTVEDLRVKKVMCLDLTAMFGSTIADYVYGLEQATAGAGVAWLSKYIDLPSYHTYDEGSIQSVQATAHVTTGKNLIDQTQFVQGSISGSGVDTAITIRLRSPFVKVLPNTQYSLSVNSEVLLFEVHQYDANKNWLGYLAVNATSYTFTTRSDAEYFKLLIRYSNNATIVVSALTALQIEFGSTATAYEPYTAHTYPLGSDTLRGYPMLIDDKLTFDGDEKYPNGTTKRKYGIVDLGTLNWTYNGRNAADTANIFYVSFSSARAVANIICGSKFVPRVVVTGTWENVGLNEIEIDYYKYIVAGSSESTAAAFKTAMDGVYLVYEKETPTIENTDPYQQVQYANKDGIEEFITTSVVPVGHYTRYPANLRAILSNEFIDDISNTAEIARNYIKTITRSGTTFTATRANGSTFSFTQQEGGGGTTYANVTSSAAGLAPASGNTANKVLRVSPSGNPIWGSDDSRELMPFNNPTTNSTGYRLTSANITPNNNGSVRTFLATSNMTTDTRPANDGNILHFSWDNQNRWGSQMAICHGNPPIVQIRHQTGAGQNDWGPWKKLIR